MLEKQENTFRELRQTSDGSRTLYVPSMDEHYHSVNGAVQESMYVFIDAGLRRMKKTDIRVLEIGFGTGLNTFLALKEVEEKGDIRIDYHTVELYPLEENVIRELNYGELLWPEKKALFETLHSVGWGAPVQITPCFTLCKIQGDANLVSFPSAVDVIFFDAFAPDKQPAMWEQAIFEKLYRHTVPGGLIVTYCAKGEVRRRMQAAGFTMQRLPGPPGKRHMLLGMKE